MADSYNDFWTDDFVAVVTAPTNTLTVSAASLAYNSRSLTNNGSTQYDAVPMLSFYTNSPNLTVNSYSFGELGYANGPGEVWVNGAYFGPITGNYPVDYTGPNNSQLTGLPGTGQRRVDIYGAGQYNRAGLRPFNSYHSLVSVVAPTGFTVQLIPPVKRSELLYVYGDSLTQLNISKAWTRVLSRNLRTACDVIVAGASALAGIMFINTAPKRAALLADYKAARAGYTSCKFWYDSMVNDVYFDEVGLTPAQMNAFWVAFAQDFLADPALANDILYFKSAIPTTSHDNAGPNALGFRLFAYRDAMSDAVASINSPRVRYADGTQLQLEQYLIPNDGTHVTEAGDAYIAGTINDFLNATSGTGDLTMVTAQQFGSQVRMSTNSVFPVEYSAETASGTNTFGPWQTATFFPVPRVPGPWKYRARLASSTSTVVTTTKTINKTLYSGSPSSELTRVGSGWTNGAYTLQNGDYYTFQGTFTGFRIYQNRQENVSEIVVGVDGGAGTTINISGPGYGTVEQLVYEVTDLPSAVHVVRVDSGAANIMNINAIELIGWVPPSEFQGFHAPGYLPNGDPRLIEDIDDNISSGLTYVGPWPEVSLGGVNYFQGTLHYIEVAGSVLFDYYGGGFQAYGQTGDYVDVDVLVEGVYVQTISYFTDPDGPNTLRATINLPEGLHHVELRYKVTSGRTTMIHDRIRLIPKP